MRVSLNGEWQLRYCQESHNMPPEDEWRLIAAMVPGNVELDLYRNGIEPDPYYAENEYEYKKYEYYTWCYRKNFLLPHEMEGKRLQIVFEGLNCIADVFVNSVLVGHSENALISHAFDITSAVHFGKENEICVRIHSALNHVKDLDYPVHISANEGTDEYTRLRIPAHSFGWDIMPRFISAGIWRSVYIENLNPIRLTQTYYTTLCANENEARLLYKYRFKTDDYHMSGYKIRVYLDGILKNETDARFVSGEGEITVDNPRLWWPRGYGKANLYNVRLELIKDDMILDSKEERIGIRIFNIIHKMAPDNDGEFLIEVNGCPILAKGSNWVPMDAFHSRDAERYERAVALFVEAGCNIMRLWGGNGYEDHKLFDLCDENGILVWHDFSMACAIYPQDRAFMDIIHGEAVQVIRKLRNHASILLWAGDNEVDESYSGRAYKPDSNVYNSLTRETLPLAVRENDPYRFFLPSSPYIADGVLRYSVPEQHNWGPRAYFKDDFYKHTNAHFISECGYHGCPNVESIKKFIPKNELWPMNDTSWKTHNAEYRIGYKRGYDRNELMADQVRIMFGYMPESLEEFCLLSQFTQAEAVKFFIERTRIRKWRRTGMIWWNMIDGWPQISDAVVDWYYSKKRAFYAIKRVQTPICVMLDEHSAWSHRIVVGNDSRETRNVAYRIIDADTQATLSTGELISLANQNAEAGDIRILPGEKKLILIEWFIDSVRYVNHYITGYPPYDARASKKWMEIIDHWAENAY